MKILNLFGKSVVSLAVFAAFGGADAAQRNSMMGSATTAVRMPTMPTVTLNTIGNPAVTTMGGGVGNSNGLPNIGSHVVPNKPNNPDKPDTPDKPDESSKCPDGGVADSKYTVQNCMDDLLQCVNNGALQGGINDLFNYDVRNSIMTGMGLCQSVIDKCVKEVRVNCRNVYNETPDVWLSFNSRVIQPEYYNFVLRKTGLTPNQAENTCLLLDRNTYGSSFAAVEGDTTQEPGADLDVEVNNEYDENVVAYNKKGDNGNERKLNPQGSKVNREGYSGGRGHYARWDAAKAECLVRVAAYNKDDLITSKWWFGGNEDVKAEVWQKAGSSFTCNKDLFDFSLLNKTKNAAVVGVTGGALLGAGTGALIGAAKDGGLNAKNRKRKSDEGFSEYDKCMIDKCTDIGYRKRLAKAILDKNKEGALDSYFEGGNVVTRDALLGMGTDGSEGLCKQIVGLFSTVEVYKQAHDACRHNVLNSKVSEIKDYQGRDCKKACCPSSNAVCPENSFRVQCSVNTGITDGDVDGFNTECSFKLLNKMIKEGGDRSPLCEEVNGCVSLYYSQYELSRLESDLSAIKSLQPDCKEPDVVAANAGKGAAIGTVVGAGAGGIATAITALVERSNITCKVGDGLNAVAYNKSHNIDSLKNFYVKWNLKLPDTVTPTAVITDYESWHQACREFNSRLMDCDTVTINIKRKDELRNTYYYDTVSSACRTAGSSCVANEVEMRIRFPVQVVHGTVIWNNNWNNNNNNNNNNSVFGEPVMWQGDIQAQQR